MQLQLKQSLRGREKSAVKQNQTHKPPRSPAQLDQKKKKKKKKKSQKKGNWRRGEVMQQCKMRQHNGHLSDKKWSRSTRCDFSERCQIGK